MGLTDSASAFQRRIQQTLAGLPRVKVYIDDILVFGMDRASAELQSYPNGGREESS
ncbi:MAG: hypothetical protein GY696_02915 [Gammaproteobacteria bacterium]|nr:hypothetical protein [Gammaproteobacteria bacterium]